jgi:cell division transport system permease protein
MKPFRILNRSIRDAFKSVFRNFSLSMASILCATITLMVVALALVVAGNIQNATKDLEKELSIVVYLEREATKEDAENLKSTILKMKNVDTVVYKSKDERKQEMSEYDPTFKIVIDNYEENPLLDSFIVTVKKASDLKSVCEEIAKLEKIESANYGENAIDQIVSIFGVVEKATIVVVVSLVFVTAFLITNTIKLTIYSRRNEIEIMRLVGASNMAIKLPFVFEGFFIGLLGALIPIIVIIYGYIIAYEKLNGHILTDIIRLISPYNFIFYIALIIAGMGAIIGMLGSLNAVRKYLKI